MTSLLNQNLFGLYFVYGLSFYSMGLAIAMQYRSYSTFRLAQSLSVLAAFGLLHGLSEWGSVFVPLQLPDVGLGAMWKLEALKLLLQAISHFLLFYFGLSLITETLGRHRWTLAVPGVVFLLWLVNFLRFLPLIDTNELVQWLTLSEVWSRYLLGFPGGLVTAWALYLQIPEVRVMGDGSVTSSLWGAAGGFLAFALVSGLVTPEAPVLLASHLNNGSFLALTGLPVEIFRTLDAFFLIFFITRILAVFHLEKEQRLDESRRREAVLQERDNLSRELHDGVLQGIYGVGLNLQAASHLLEGQPRQAKEKLAYSLEHLNGIIQNIRAYIDDWAESTEATSLEKLTSVVVEEFRRAYPDIAFRLELSNLPGGLQLGPGLEHHYVNLLREACSNAVRHSQGSLVTVALDYLGEELVIRVTDNGIGYWPAAGGGDRHYGLANMKRRAVLLGGRLLVWGEPGRGTVVSLFLPLSTADRRLNGAKALGQTGHKSIVGGDPSGLS